MSNDKEGSFISNPFLSDNVPKATIGCPKCGNEGQDGSITGVSTQYTVLRSCKKCGHKWQGGIGVGRADPSSEILPPEVAPPIDDAPAVQFTGSPFRDPKKNVDR